MRIQVNQSQCSGLLCRDGQSSLTRCSGAPVLENVAFAWKCGGSRSELREEGEAGDDGDEAPSVVVFDEAALAQTKGREEE